MENLRIENRDKTIRIVAIKLQLIIRHRNFKGRLASSGTFNSKQMEQFYKMLSNFQILTQSSTYVPFGSLTHKGNFLKALSITSRVKTIQIIDSSASDHMTNAYLFSSYLLCTGNLKVKITYDTISPIARKKVSKSLIL